MADNDDTFIGASVENVWHRWQFMFSESVTESINKVVFGNDKKSNGREKDIEEDIIKFLSNTFSNRTLNVSGKNYEIHYKWVNPYRENIKLVIKEANSKFLKTGQTQDVARIEIIFKEERPGRAGSYIDSARIWLKRSFYWEIDFDIKVDDGTIGNVIKDFEQIEMCDYSEQCPISCKHRDVCNYIKEEILKHLSEYLISWLMVLDIYKYNPSLDFSSIVLKIPPEKSLISALHQIPVKYACLIEIDGGHLFFASQYRANSPYWFIFLHDTEPPVDQFVEEHGGEDVVHKFAGLLYGQNVLEIEDEYMINIYPDIIENNRKTYEIIENLIRAEEGTGNLKELNNQFLNIIDLKRNLLGISERASEIIKYNEQILEQLYKIGEKTVNLDTSISNKSLITHLSQKTKLKNKDIEFRLQKLQTNIEALERTIMDANSTEMLEGIHKSLSTEAESREILKSLQMTHGVVFVIELLIISHIILSTLEYIPHYEEFHNILKVFLNLAAISAGIVGAVILTRIIVQMDLAHKIIRPSTERPLKVLTKLLILLLAIVVLIVIMVFAGMTFR